MRYRLLCYRAGPLRGSMWGNAKSPSGDRHAAIYDAHTGARISPIYRVDGLVGVRVHGWTPDSKFAIFYKPIGGPFFGPYVLPNPALVNATPLLK